MTEEIDIENSHVKYLFSNTWICTLKRELMVFVPPAIKTHACNRGGECFIYTFFAARNKDFLKYLVGKIIEEQYELN